MLCISETKKQRPSALLFSSMVTCNPRKQEHATQMKNVLIKPL